MDDADVIKFGTLHPDGTVTDERELTRGQIRACPWFIFYPVHYREDGSCRCDDNAHSEMLEWGYTWSMTNKRWEAADENPDA